LMLDLSLLDSIPRSNMEGKRIAFIRARDFDTEDPEEYYPLGLGYLAAYIEQREPEISCKICNTIREIVSFSPQIIGISSTSTAYESAKDIAKAIRKELPTALIVLGGYHITALPYSLTPDFDIGVIGEGEETMLYIVRSCYYDDIPTMLFKGTILPFKGRLHKTSPRPYIKDLNSLPYPYRNIQAEHAKDVPMFTSRGCPYDCLFCASTTHWGKYRKFSAEYVIREMKHLVQAYNVDSILLHDDLFIADRTRFKTIADTVIRGELGKPVKFHGFVRSNLVTEGIVILLKQMGFTSIRFGAESGSPKILKFLKGNTPTIEDHQNTIDLCAKHNLPVGGSFVFGTPGETLEDLIMTYNFIKKNEDKFKIMGFYILTPIPGTRLWGIAKDKGLVSDTMDWRKLNQDPRRDAFNWDNMIYLNNDIIPKNGFINIINSFMDIFSVNPKGKG